MGAARRLYEAAGWWNEHWGRVKTLVFAAGLVGAVLLIVGGVLVHRFGVLGTVAIAIGGLVLLVSVVAFSIGHRAITTPVKADRAKAVGERAGTLIRATGTNDIQFPRIEVAVDSLGHTAKRTLSDALYAITEAVLRPGHHVTFAIEASDPNGEDLVVTVLTPGGSRTDVAIASDGTIVWNVGDEDIADPGHVHIYVASQRDYHRQRDWDDSASFVYRVLPRLV